MLGMCEGSLLHLTTPSAATGYGSFRHDRRKDMSKTTITAKMRSDGSIVQDLPGGGEREFPKTPIRRMTEAEIKAAAEADPDARPMSRANSGGRDACRGRKRFGALYA